MTEAARMAPHLAGPAWILAHEQTGARGRRGRPWRMPAGNMAATLVMRPNVPPATAALYSFVAALALYDALRWVAPDLDMAIKWPNDVLINGGKCAGILLESATLRGDTAFLSIGIGVNLAAVPDVGTLEARAVAPVSLLQASGMAIPPEDFLTPLAAAFAQHARTFETLGFAPIRSAWLARAARIGQPLVARTGTTTYEGIFETIDETGAMILRTADGMQAISAADVFF